MTLGESISTCFKKYFVIQGRASKSEFWWFQLIWVVSYLATIIFENESVTFFFLGIIIIIAIPLFAVGIRRLHDTNKSGFNVLWSFLPFIGGIVVLAFMIGDGTKGKNQYGENQLKKSKSKKKVKKKSKVN